MATIEGIRELTERFEVEAEIREKYHRKELRDRFAIAALTGPLSSETESESWGSGVEGSRRFANVAQQSYLHADAMLAARETGKGSKQ